MNKSIPALTNGSQTSKLLKVSIIGLTLGSAAIVWADDDKSEAKSSASSSTESSTKKSSNTKIEVQVIEERDGNDSDKAPKRRSTRTFSVQGNNGKSVEKAIDQLQEKLGDAELPKALQNQAIEALRSYSSAQGQATIVVKDGQEGEPKVFTFRTDHFLPGFVSPDVRSRLSKAIEKAIDEENLEAEVAKRLNDKIQSALEKISNIPITSTPQYRIGIRLGSSSQQADADGSEKEGQKMKVQAVFDDSPAAQAGVKVGDRIISANGRTIQTPEELTEMVQEAGESDKAIELLIVSDGTEKKLSIKPNRTPIADFKMPQLNGMNPQAWLMNPREWPGLVPGVGNPPNSWGFQAGKQAREAAEELLAEQKDELNKKILEELKELEDEVAEIKSMLKQLLEKK
jgi:PDZ domain